MGGVGCVCVGKGVVGGVEWGGWDGGGGGRGGAMGADPHIRVISESYPSHIRVISEPYPIHIRVISESYPDAYPSPRPRPPPSSLPGGGGLEAPRVSEIPPFRGRRPDSATTSKTALFERRVFAKAPHPSRPPPLFRKLRPRNSAPEAPRPSRALARGHGRARDGGSAESHRSGPGPDQGPTPGPARPGPERNGAAAR